MKVGLGLYRHMLTREYYDFARQSGCTHVVVHLVDYFNQGTSNPRHNQPTGGKYPGESVLASTLEWFRLPDDLDLLAGSKVGAPGVDVV